MVAPLAKAIDLTMSLTSVGRSAGVILEKGREFMRAVAMMPREDGDRFLSFARHLDNLPASERDALLAEARRLLVRELSAEVRRQRSNR